MNVSYGLYPIGEQYLYDVLERKLEKRSEKGWVADYIGRFLIRYKRCEPKPRKVQIVFDPENVEYKTEKSDYTQGLEDYIESAGWVKACDYYKQKVYYNDDLNAVPIDTDDRMKLESIKDSMVGLGFLTLVTIIFIAFFGLMFGGGFIKAIDHISFRGAVLIAAILYFPMFFMVDYCMYSLWLEKSEKNLQAGLGLASTKPSHIASIIMTILLFVIAGLIIVANSITNPTTSMLKELLGFLSFFVIISVGRRVGVTMKDRKAGSAMTYVTMVVLMVILKLLLDVVVNGL